ncbi:hypothetical protein [Haloarcula nitratireducens]|uniref:Uncharacterized protein n=1 Tax=Haloarcula nitratireducens TaxID=2487749 RepID=A0AAW4PE86_9EURY|nr:hypothetical protein [Halomicroarcula nitratireducens]MBX0296179.1 hypothetical protein [Halomicroarcula nitratireducens]
MAEWLRLVVSCRRGPRCRRRRRLAQIRGAARPSAFVVIAEEWFDAIRTREND